ncbi:hypothetical protein [Ureaplasma canigenitalium]|uniref:hypothetical protein n=1 Tax=Ureaplasma canigenitalium TaxID=42092 RepID=UPI0004E2613E|nr:hypothetical protein [Ureaplasma canigenitalium]
MVNNELTKNQKIIDYQKRLENISRKDINDDQKSLIISILEKLDERMLDNAFYMLINRVKTGLVFDIAPALDHESIALLKKDQKRSFFNNTEEKIDNTLVIGENFDALKNLVVIENERERERERHLSMM